MKKETSGDSGRLCSIDVFRGITIAAMILVNNQGDWAHVYPPLRHAAWHGWLGADFVFPFFLFIMGTGLSFRHGTTPGTETKRSGMLCAILRRSALLVALGLALNFFPEFSFDRLRIPGVLQRIGICYLTAAILVAYTPRSVQAGITILTIALYGAGLVWFSLVQCGTTSLWPDCNLPGRLDAILFTGHTYEHAPVTGFDPEGLLSTVAATASVMLGVLSGNLIGRDTRSVLHQSALPAGGIALAGLGLALDTLIPINKNLWTPSYILFTGGAAMLFLALLHHLNDKRKIIAPLTPFIAMGRNAIIIYVLSTMAGKAMVGFTFSTAGADISIKGFIFRECFSSWLTGPGASLAYAAVFLIPWIILSLVLYRTKIFIRI